MCSILAKKWYVHVLIVTTILLCGVCGSRKSGVLRDNLPTIKEIQKVAIILRISHNSIITYERFCTTLQMMLAGYKHTKQIVVMTEHIPQLNVFRSNDERFFQLSLEGDFLYYKALGIINSYCSRNREYLEKIFNENNCDLVMIYEPYGIISYGMGFIEYDTVLSIINKDFHVVYLDYESHHKETKEFSVQILEDYLVNEINTRCVQTLIRLRLLK